MKLNIRLVIMVLVGLGTPFTTIAMDRDIFLVRHAEKQADGSNDPALTAQGLIRANNIASQLVDKNITAIYSSDYQRTRQTAAPLAKQLNLSVIIYDPRELAALAEQLKQRSGNLLIVGHSNTTPQLSQLLGGRSFGEIDEKEYDRVYQLNFTDDQVKTELLHSKSK